MKLLATLLLIFTVAYQADAQKSGRVVYESIYKISDEDLARVPEQYRSYVPKERKSNYELLYTSEESLYRFTQVESEENQMGGRRGWRSRMGGRFNNTEIYNNISEGRSVEKTEMFDKIFLVKETPEKLKWKMTGEKTMFGNHMCMQATSTYRDSIDVVDWFTPQIPLSIGPGTWNGLPGLIVQVELNEGQTTIFAKEFEDLAEDNDIEEPTKGKEVSREELKEIREEKMEEMKKMREARGQGEGNRRGSRIIIGG